MGEGSRIHLTASLNRRALELILSLREQGEKIVEREIVERRLLTFEEQLREAEALQGAFAVDLEFIRAWQKTPGF